MEHSAMEYSPEELDQIYYNHFMKTLLMNDIANEFGYFMIQCGAANFMDVMDMKCGAVPNGEYEQVIDQGAAPQFLELYMRVAEFRLAYAVTQVLAIKPEYIDGMKKFVAQVGRENWGKPVTNVQEAFSLYNTFIHDGMPFSEPKQLLEVTGNRVVWQEKQDNHAGYWEKAGGSVTNFWLLHDAFVEGLFDSSGIKFLHEGDNFILEMSQN